MTPLRPAAGTEPLGRRAFSHAPQAVADLASAVLEPVVIVLTLFALHQFNEVPFGRWATAVSLMIIALTFPGRTRWDATPWRLLRDVWLNWLVLLAILLLCAYVTRSLADLDWPMVWQWVQVTPWVHWACAVLLRAVMQRRVRQDRLSRHAVVVGGGALALRTARALAERDASRLAVVGYFDDRQDERLTGEARALWLGRIDEVARYVDKLCIKEVYITLPMASQPRLAGLVDALQSTTASLFFVPDVLGTHIVQGRLQDVSGLPVVGICETPFTGTHGLVKRLSDVLLAALVLLLAAPLWLLLALGVRLSGPGPVLYRQRRIGLDGEEIILTKFRTLQGAESRRIQRDGLAQGEPTAFGRWVQRFSLDDLPQFLDVLQGRLSIVGPRPHAINHGAQYRQQVKGYMVRHKARPGITGWAQINGQRGVGDSLEALRARTELDLEYLRQWSLGLDLHIMARALGGALRRGWRGH